MCGAWKNSDLREYVYMQQVHKVFPSEGSEWKLYLGNEVPSPGREQPSPASLMARGGADIFLVEHIRLRWPSLRLPCTSSSSLAAMDPFSTAAAPVYKYKAVSLENLFHFNYLINLVHGCVQKPPAVSAAASSGVNCARGTLETAAGRWTQPGCQGHRAGMILVGRDS